MRYTEIMVKLFCLFVFCGRISFVVEDVTFDPVSHTRFYRSRACPHSQVPIFFNWLENIHFPRKVTQVFYVIIKTELYCWAGLIMQVDICVTVTMLSWSPLNSLLLGDSSPHQAPLLESFTITATSKSHFFFLTEDCSFSLDCLKYYSGKTIIHIGELFGETLSSNPWGQTTSRAFQLRLGETFRCVSRVQLPNWPGHMDSLTVWSRAPDVVDCDGADMVFIPLKNTRYFGWSGNWWYLHFLITRLHAPAHHLATNS